MRFFKREKQPSIAALISDAVGNVKAEALEENAKLRLKIRDLETELNQKQAELNNLLPKLREQNEADILLMVKRIEARIVAGEKKENCTEELQRLANLQAQQSYLRNIGVGSSLGGLLHFRSW